jgi:dynein heavy chain
MLREKQAKLAEVEAKIAELQKTYDDSMAEKQKLERNISTTAARLKRAAKLTTALGDEQVRWGETVDVSVLKFSCPDTTVETVHFSFLNSSSAHFWGFSYIDIKVYMFKKFFKFIISVNYCLFLQKFNIEIGNVTGDVFVGAACVAYYGAFTSVYRHELVENWIQRCKELDIPVTQGMTITSVLADNYEIRQWNTDGLPKDQVSTENAILVTRGRRWPLMIDPQEQVRLLTLLTL